MKKGNVNFIKVLEEFSGVIVHKLNNIVTPLLMLKSLHKEDKNLTEHISNIYDKLDSLKESLNEFALKRSARERPFSPNKIFEKLLNTSLPVDYKITGNPERFEWAVGVLRDYAKLEKISVKSAKGGMEISIPLNQSIKFNQMDLNQERIDYNYIDLLLSNKIITRYGWKFQIETHNLLKISYSISLKGIRS